MEKDRDSMAPLKDVIAGLFSDGTLPFDPEDASIWKVWEEVVGSAISKNAQPSRIRNRELRVTVSNAIWLQELKFLEEDIRERLNRILGRKAVDRIEFRVGPQ